MKKPILFFCIFGLLFTACQNKKNSAISQASTNLQSLSLGMMPTLDGLPFLVAQQQGIYDSLGLDLGLCFFSSANERDGVFQSGQVDGIITDYISVIYLQSLHFDISLIMKNESYSCFIVSKEKQINQPQELKQKNIAISHNTIIEYATEKFLKNNNIQLSDVNMPEINSVALRMQMLEYGQIDASFLPDPYASIAMNSGHKSFISTKELDINLTGTAFSRKSINKKRKEIELLVRGYNLGVDYMHKHPQKEWEQALLKLGVPNNLTGLIVLPNYSKATRPSIPDMENAIRWLKDKKRISNSFPEAQLIDTTYIHTQNIP